MVFDFQSELSGISKVINVTCISQKLTASIDAVDSYGFDRFPLSSSHSLHMSSSGISTKAGLLSSAQVLHASTYGRTGDETVDQILDAETDYNWIDSDVASRANNLKVAAIAHTHAPNTFKSSLDGDILNNFPQLKTPNTTSNQLFSNPILTSLLNQTASVDAFPRPTTNQNLSVQENLTNQAVLINSQTVPILDAVNTAPIFTNFSVIDASGDSTLDTVLEGGAIKVSYELLNSRLVSNVKLEVLQFDSIVDRLGTWNQSKISNNLINLANVSSIAAGDYLVRAIASTTDKQEIFSSFQSLRILPWKQNLGSFTADTFNYSNLVPEEAAVFLGRGGTDTLNLLGISPTDVTSINGINISAFNLLSNSTANQAIFKGTAFDYLTLADGREIYFQGIENLKFAGGSNLELQVRPNDVNFGIQWNFHVSDVDSAWRFTQGTNNILLVSLDTGILTAPGASGSIFDLATNRLITDPTDDDNQDDDANPNNGTTTYGHGHSSISIMSSIANNNSGVAGINWNSQVYVTDVYGGVSLQQAIGDAINYARANNMRVVFQTGIQGDYWLNYSGGTRSQLEQLIQNNSDIALFAVGAGNGGAGGNYQDPNYLTSVNGLARLETMHSNVMSVGALETKANVNGLSQWQYELVNGLMNAKVANIAPYSNRGSNLTLMAATDSPAMDKYGYVNYFGGTSAANPNLAGIASLVWSVNPNLNASQVRQILTDTAMDLGGAGRDNTFGYGLVNADAAVRRAWALHNNSELANLYQSSSLLV